ncbi:PRC-barrel domain-containing protein [Argonema galeatum A003/A1]|nr:PRC-barrel domain-containing protein [Argonema galeatum A003/A1]
MSMQQSVIRQSDLLNQLVLDRRTAEELGRVDYLWLNPKAHRVEGFTCKSGFLGGKKRSFIWDRIESIGADGIMVNFNAEEFADPEKSEQVFSLIGHEVWTKAGDKAGKVVDYLLVPQTGAVINYLFSSSGWRGVLDGIYLLALTDISSIGSKRLLVPDSVVQNPQYYAEGLNQKVSQAAEFIQEDYHKTQTELEGMRRGAQNVAGQWQDKAKLMAGQAKEKAQDVAGQAKERAQDVAGQVKERAQDVAGQVKEKIADLKASQPLEHEPNAALPPAPDIIEIKAEVIRED